MCHQKLHLVLGCTVAFAVVAGTAGGNHIHPIINTVLGKGNDVLAGKFLFMKMSTTIRAHIAVARKEFAIRQPRLHLKRIDLGHTARADDAIHRDDGLLTRDGVMPAMEHSHLRARLPAYVLAGIVNHRLFKRNPRLGQPLGRQLQNFQNFLRTKKNLH